MSDTPQSRAQSTVTGRINTNKNSKNKKFYYEPEVVQSVLLGYQMWQQILDQPRYAEPGRLLRYGNKCYSQNDEDGILLAILQRIGVTNQSFIEIGCGRGYENNTVLLLKSGWRGLWIEGSKRAYDNCKAAYEACIANQSLTLLHEFVTINTVNQLIQKSQYNYNVDVLSLDIDGNDYYILQALTVIKPRVIIVEYNAKFPPPIEWRIVLNDRNIWQGDDYFGASLASWCQLLTPRGYALVGCNVTGINAFFVRQELLGDHFAAPYSAENHYEPARYHLWDGLFKHIGGHPWSNKMGLAKMNLEYCSN